MEKKEIVKQAFKRGVLLSPDVLNIINTLPPIQTQTIITSPHTTQCTVKHEQKKTLTICDVVSATKKKYDTLQHILLERLHPVSINNITHSSGEITIIVMVRERLPHGFCVEDMTGTIEVITTEQMQPGDVVGVTGRVREGKLIASIIEQPDIPIPKEVKRVNVTLLLTPQPLQEKEIQLLFRREPAENTLHISTNPATCVVNGVDVVVFKGSGDPKVWLKKRQLPGNITGGFVITTIPDILWVVCDDGANSIGTYKGVTIVTTNKKSFARVNMFTRYVEFGNV